jgi:RimJ/RimL family protein N-acetyltransferase
MTIQKDNLTIRDATEEDAELLCAWWNNGKVMAHAGFPDGLHTSVESVENQLSKCSDERGRVLIIEGDGTPIGEMSYWNKGNGVAEIGIKICDFSMQDQGLGTRFLIMLIENLLTEQGYTKIILDTNLNNIRAQHVYEKIGFRKVGVRTDAWRNQLGELQSSVDYEMTKENWVYD